jgi:hypothetical protein
LRSFGAGSNGRGKSLGNTSLFQKVVRVYLNQEQTAKNPRDWIERLRKIITANRNSAANGGNGGNDADNAGNNYFVNSIVGH